MPMTRMQIDAWGGPEAFHLVEVDFPVPGEGELLVEVRAAGLNPVDYKVRSGAYAAAMDSVFPLVLGRDFSGVITAVGAGREEWSVGDEVSGSLRFEPRTGTYATHLVVGDAALAAKPSDVPFVEAAALPIVGMTAWQALFGLGDLQSGQRVLVHAGAGGVGHMAVQLAHRAGAYVVTTCSAGNADFVKELGADEVIDYNAVAFDQSVADIDLVLDTQGADVLHRSFAVVKDGGCVVTIVRGGFENPATARGVRDELLVMQPDADLLTELLDLVDTGQLHVHVEREFPLPEVADAHRVLEAGHVRGKFALVNS
jgi:NADPH:quinone reductase-like Zn-dependent oxidoreductase